ncbi:hypothetical protein ACWCQ1_23115 [Streptomyces sp. NPDC002144]
MRWWAGVWVAAGVVALVACGGSTGGGGGSGSPSPGRSSGPPASPSAGSSSTAPASPSPTPPSSPSGSRSASPSASASAAGCVAGHAEVTVAPGDPVERQLCVRPGTVVTLVLRPRVDDRRWTAVSTSAPAFVVVSGWRQDADGTAHASLRSAGARGGTARITALAKAPDVAGAARPGFTLRMSVVPYPTQG